MIDLWIKASVMLPSDDCHICFKDYLGRYRDAYVITKTNQKKNITERSVVTLPKHGLIIKKWKEGYWLNEIKLTPDLHWVKVSNQKPPDGIDGQILYIKPIKILRSIYALTYNCLIYMGKHDGGLAWHWYEGPRSGWHTKITLEEWDKIEYLHESKTT